MSTALRILVRHGNDNYGPYSVAEVNSMLASGRVRPDYLAWVEGEPAWRQLHTVPGVLPGPGSSAPPLRARTSRRPSPARARSERDRR